MFHVALHFVVPVLVALAFYRPAWRRAALLLLATMVVDVDHLIADPIWDPQRCSIGFHPLHTLPAIVLYGLLFIAPFALRRSKGAPDHRSALHAAHLIGLGLLIHMALDWGDCIL